MYKPEWGTKRTCPKCSTRFYDLGNDDPVVCIECGTEWAPEPILKSKQPTVVAEAKKAEPTKDTDDDLDDDLDVDVEEDEDEDDDSVLAALGDDDDDDDVTVVLDTKVTGSRDD